MKKKYNKIYLFSTFCIIFMLIFINSGCKQRSSVYNPKAIQGVLDLRDFDESSDVIISLDGQWEFYWNQLIDPSDFKKNIKPITYIQVPKAWNKQEDVSYSFPAFGYATCRLLILHNVKFAGQIKTIKMPFVHTAYSLWANGKLISENGKVGTSKESMIPFQLPTITQFAIDSSTTELVLQISNFQQRNGGILRHIYYGNFNTINKHHEIDLFITLFVVAALFIVLIYHLGLFVINRTYHPNLYFALFCAIIAIRVLLTDEKLFVKLIPFLPWEIYLRLEYLTIMFGMVTFAHFVNELFQNKLNTIILKSIDIYFGFFAIFVLVVPVMYVSYSLIYINIALVLSGLYMLIVMIRETNYNSPNSLLYIFGVTFLFFTLIHDILFAQQLINSVYLLEIGLLIFVFTQSLVALEESIKIQNRLVTINSELEIARKIQKTILPEVIPSTQQIRIEACYIPMDEIGGDFYHFYELDANKIGVLIADVTGHGIPASLIASTVNIAFSLQRNYASNPAEVMANMNSILYGKTGGQPITALYAYIDSSDMVVKFSRAGHPLPLIWQSDTKKVREINVPGKILGVFNAIKTDVVEYKINIHDRIILYTDGIVEIRNMKNEIFGLDRFISYIEKFYYLNPEEFIDVIIDALIQWAGSKNRITDDITLVVIDIK